MSNENINYVREAFFHPLNLGVLFTSTLSAFFLSDFGLIPNALLTFTFGLELVYLGVVPRLSSFIKQTKLKKIKEREPVLESKNVFNSLTEVQQKKFLVLKHLTLKVRENFEKQPYTSQGLLVNIEKKIDGLLNNYINLLDLHKRFLMFVQSVNEENLIKEIESEEQEMEKIDSERLKERKKRRILILRKRLERIKSASERYEICNTEIDTIEDAIRYIYEQSMTMNNPEEIGFQLDNLLSEVEETSSIIESLESSGYDEFGIFDKKTEADQFSEESGSTGSVNQLKRGEKL